MLCLKNDFFTIFSKKKILCVFLLCNILPYSLIDICTKFEEIPINRSDFMKENKNQNGRQKVSDPNIKMVISHDPFRIGS